MFFAHRSPHTLPEDGPTGYNPVMEEHSVRAMVFIDGNNLYHRLKERGWPTFIQVGKLALRLAGGRQLAGIYYYNAAPPEGSEHKERGKAYLALIRGAPDIVFRQSRLQPTQRADRYGDYRTYVEKGADTALSADMVRCAAADEYDVAILVSSDGDFAPVSEMIRDIYDKPVEVVYFKATRPFAMEDVALMREFRQGLLEELDFKPESTEGGRRVSILKWPEGALLNLG